MALIVLAASAAGAAAVPVLVAEAPAQDAAPQSAPFNAARHPSATARDGAPAQLERAAFHPRREAAEPPLRLTPEADEETSPYALLLLGGGVMLLASRRRRPAPWAPSQVE